MKRVWKMLVLSRKSTQRIVISETVVITILNVQGNRVRIGVEAPPEVVIRRSELPPQAVAKVNSRNRQTLEPLSQPLQALVSSASTATVSKLW